MVLVNPMELPADLPVPQDDGGARHLPGMRAPDLPLPATDGNPVNLGQLSGRTIVYVYPRTGRPGVPLPEGWDAIPGARGCTPQSCGFRDHLQELHALGVHIWDGNAFADYWRERARFPGDAGRNYGQQWRDWVAPDGRRIDQLREVIRLIREQPSSRRMLVTAWNPGEIDATSLPACHAFFQFFVEGSRLSLMMYQRSCDLVLGVPFNMAQYALLLHLVAREVELEPHEFVHVLADAHVYLDHVDAAREQLSREPFPSPLLWLDPGARGVDDAVARYRDILARVERGEAPGPLLDGFARLERYQHHPPIKAKMAV